MDLSSFVFVHLLSLSFAVGQRIAPGPELLASSASEWRFGIDGDHEIDPCP
jgi:hypothetical protein